MCTLCIYINLVLLRLASGAHFTRRWRVAFGSGTLAVLQSRSSCVQIRLRGIIGIVTPITWLVAMLD